MVVCLYLFIIQRMYQRGFRIPKMLQDYFPAKVIDGHRCHRLLESSMLWTRLPNIFPYSKKNMTFHDSLNVFVSIAESIVLFRTCFFSHCFPTCDGHMYRDKFKCTSWIYQNLSVLCLEKCTLQGTNILSHRKRNIFLKSALGKRYVRSRGGYFFTTYLFVFFGPKLQDDYIDCGQ